MGMARVTLSPLVLPVQAFPEPEQLAVWHIFILLGQLTIFVRRFEEAYDLFRYSKGYVEATTEAMKNAPNQETRNTLGYGLMDSCVPNWRGIALRDAALTVYHFGASLHAIQFSKCPTVAGLVDSNALRNVRRLFRARFPHWEKIRNAVSHAGDAYETPETLCGHAYVGDYDDGRVKSVGGTLFLPGHLKGETLIWTWKSDKDAPAEVISVECSKKALDQLVDITQRVYQVISPAALFGFRHLREQKAKNGQEEKLPPEQG
jgi:hypothetical protein